jgi:hypothetical protein
VLVRVAAAAATLPPRASLTPPRGL